MRTRPQTERATDSGARGVQVRNGTAPITLDFDARCHVTYRRLRANDERRKRCLTRHWSGCATAEWMPHELWMGVAEVDAVLIKSIGDVEAARVEDKFDSEGAGRHVAT
ncbi:hypothetical protein ACOZ38_20785 [Sphaerisporangium viridialbum]|uniref:hypothetical protein n=1 Tax=Sphaerisporangium viridialbum TaxID=46189 RepID=UPI003C766A4A